MSTSRRPLVRAGSLAMACAMSLAACGGGLGGEADGGDVVTQVSDIRVINPAMVVVDFTAENSSGGSLTLECQVAVIDPDGTSGGSKSVTLTDVAPGATQPASVQVEVSDEGAEFVTQASVECSGR